MDNISVRNKYDELYLKYAKRNIDDFDTFVRARVAEHYINTYHIPTDEVYVRIEEALCKPNAADIASDEIATQNATSGDIEYFDSNVGCSTFQHTTYNDLMKALPYLAAVGATAIGLITWVVKRRKWK